MTGTKAALLERAKERLIVALDVETTAEAASAIEELKDVAGAFKVGLQLFTSAGPNFVRDLTSSGVRVFLDVKYHDIPNTVAKASVEAARLGVWMFNVHASGGREMMMSAAEEVHNFCARESLPKPKVIGVTVLTSMDQLALSEMGITQNVENRVVKLARLAAECGLDGVVASPRETRTIIDAVDQKGFKIVTPGIRPHSATSDDQKRVMTPAEAVSEGSDYLVIGRPILQANDRESAARAILMEIAQELLPDDH